MNQLINVTLNENQEPVVSGRDLHKVLEIKTAYKDWFPRMAEYGFEECQDFSSFLSKSTGGRPKQDHVLKLDMAKEIAMLQRNEKSKQVRQYFIQVEKTSTVQRKIMARALLMADKKVHKLEAQIEADRPKVLFADAVEASETSILIGDFAKILRRNGYNIGQNRLFAWLRENGFLIRKNGESYNMPTQRSMDMKLFEVKERTHQEPNGSIRISKTTKMTGKGQQYFINKFLNEKVG
ncbi:phage antirepressor KilAC domain-containing protein [Streptococcus dysgalactiae subsp. equisimilis]|uniref:Phage antirepressor KilAC domain-containing protein n=1 Tax=Streptococcus dysgalactiae subsp. equisimilis TaxID=119602 RepID=A0A9X8XI87_STREQ|nr:phage antirepressor KilAC domain-containing protein [Streptococcus dysgalactiae]SUN64444.1 phage antirepressor KilAC domain-containing protein [Streptococcus dysgalactiae subsp. equisimilis]